MNIIKFSYNFLIYAVILLLLAACGFGGDATPTPPPQPVKLTMVSFDNLAIAQSALIAKFQETHPGITIDLSPLRQDWEGYLTQPQPPDLLLFLPGPNTKRLIEEGLITDITDIWEQSGFNDSYPAALRKMSELDGKQYFLPTGYAWNGIFYNKAIFAQYGLQEPKTWDELMLICETLLTNNEVPFAIAGDQPFMTTLWIDYLSLRLNGPAFHRRFLQGEIPYTDPQIRPVFERLQFLSEQGYVLENANTLNNFQAMTALVRDDQGMLGRNKAVMTLSGPVFFDDFPKKFRDELDFFAFPTIDPNIPPAEVTFAAGYVVPSGATNREYAFTFLRFLASEDAKAVFQQDVSREGEYVPALALSNADLPANIRKGIEQVRDVEDITSPFITNVNPTIFLPLSNLFRKILPNSLSDQAANLDDLLEGLEEMREK